MLIDAFNVVRQSAHNLVPIWNPMCTLHMALLSIVLTVADMNATEGLVSCRT